MTTDKRHNARYRIPSARAQWWDYDTDGVMQLSEIGEVVQQCWQVIPQHSPFVLLDEFVVMPNHVHGVLMIDKGEGDTGHVDDVETLHATSLQKRQFR